MIFYSSELTDFDLVSQAVSFFANGYDTVSSTLSFALHELALQPEIQERLAQEIKLEHARQGNKVTLQSIQNMEYMDMVISGKRGVTSFKFGQANLLYKLCYFTLKNSNKNV